MNDITADSPKKSGMTPGSWTVIAMFSFGILMVSLLWVYWEAYTRPFRELQNAIAEQYPGSSPRVVGGKHKSHKNITPMTLRIIVRIPIEGKDSFHPVDDEPEGDVRALDLVRIGNEHAELNAYEVVEVHLMQIVPESKTRHRKVSHTVDEWEALLAPKSRDGKLNPSRNVD